MKHRASRQTPPAREGWRWILAVLFLGYYFFLTTLEARAEPSFTEYQVKAAFLFNFSKYVDWPAEAFVTTNAPIIIGVLGNDNFKDDLKRDILGKMINGRAIITRHVVTDDEIKSCHILFISFSENARLAEILSKTKALPILTVGENEQFTQQGGIINFVMKESKVRMEIGLASARQSKLQISSRLLSIAEVVKGGPD